ncbi:MAG TPA: thiamine ABC transporter substrate binding subunit, partial [Rhodobacteraceae bacterium]|nr:thiamine ABC transporter substrate binding subunit [Paracoccaceae bacterium]
MNKFLFAAALCLPFGSAAAETLTVYTYDSFVSDWGPGPQIKAAFEAECDCTLEFVSAGDGAALLARLWLEGERTEADVVLGLDNSLMASAREMDIFAPLAAVPEGLALPIAWQDDTFLPYDWGYLAFVYDNTKLSEVPSSFEALAGSDLSIVIQDPRSSTPGLGLALWVKAAYGEDAEAVWQGLSDNIVTVTKGWSEAYGMFLEGEADMVLSYTTSPAYHLIAEGDPSKSAAQFSEGHYLQVEVAAKLVNSEHQALADEFLAFITTDAFQNVIPETNWMYPATGAAVPEGFGGMITPAPVAGLLTISDADRKAAVEEWVRVLS